MKSAREFRNVYERFYDCMRNYLWPYNVLEDLADVEVQIYTAFIDRDQLKRAFDKLSIAIRELRKEDKYLDKTYKELQEVIDDPDTEMYADLSRVEEVHPDADKQIKSEEETDEEDIYSEG